MFFKSKDGQKSRAVGPFLGDKKSTGTTLASSAQQYSPQTSPLENFKDEGVVLVGKGTRMLGEIKDARVIEVQGRFEGDVSAEVVIVREGAEFRGNIVAQYVAAHGQIDGSITAEQLLVIKSTGRVRAEARYGQLSVDRGGELSGHLATHTIDADPNPEVEESIAVDPPQINGFHHH